MRYRSFGDRIGPVSAITVRLDDGRHKGSALDWRDFVFAAFEAGINSFEIGHTTPNLLSGVGEALSAMERRLYVISWRTTLAGGPLETVARVRERASSLGLKSIDLLTLELDGPLRDPALLGDLRGADMVRWLSVAGPNPVLDMSIVSGEFDGMTLRLDPAGGWNERNRIKAANNRGMGVVAFDVGLEIAPPDTDPPRPGLFRLFARQGPPQISSTFRVDVPGWTDQQIAIAHTLTDPCISTLVVQPTCIPSLEALAWCVDHDLPAGAAAQIEMARFSNVAVEETRPQRRRARR